MCKRCVSEFGCYDVGDVHESTKGEVKVFEKVLGDRVELIAIAFLRQAFHLTGRLTFWTKDVT